MNREAKADFYHMLGYTLLFVAFIVAKGQGAV